MKWKHENLYRTSTHLKAKKNQTRSKVIQPHIKQPDSGHASTTTHKTHFSLNHYLHCYKIKGTPYCECGQGKERAEHFLLKCQKYNEERKELWKEVESEKMRTEDFLGYPKLTEYTMQYVTITKGKEILHRKRGEKKEIIKHD